MLSYVEGPSSFKLANKSAASSPPSFHLLLLLLFFLLSLLLLLLLLLLLFFFFFCCRFLLPLLLGTSHFSFKRSCPLFFYEPCVVEIYLAALIFFTTISPRLDGTPQLFIFIYSVPRYYGFIPPLPSFLSPCFNQYLCLLLFSSSIYLT